MLLTGIWDEATEVCTKKIHTGYKTRASSHVEGLHQRVRKPKMGGNVGNVRGQGKRRKEGEHCSVFSLHPSRGMPLWTAAAENLRLH